MAGTGCLIMHQCPWSFCQPHCQTTLPIFPWSEVCAYNCILANSMWVKVMYANSWCLPSWPSNFLLFIQHLVKCIGHRGEFQRLMRWWGHRQREQASINTWNREWTDLRWTWAWTHLCYVQPLNLLELEGAWPSTCRNGMWTILSWSYLRCGQKRGTFRTSFLSPLRAGNKSLTWKVHFLHLEVEGHPYHQRWWVQAERPVSTNLVTSLIDYPKPQLCLDSSLIEHPKSKLLCPVSSLQTYCFFD